MAVLECSDVYWTTGRAADTNPPLQHTRLDNLGEKLIVLVVLQNSSTATNIQGITISWH